MKDIVIPIKCKTMWVLIERLKRINATLLIIATLIAWGILIYFTIFKVSPPTNPGFVLYLTTTLIIGTMAIMAGTDINGDHVIYNLSYFSKAKFSFHLPKIRCKGDDEE